MDIDSYLARVGYKGQVGPAPNVLEGLHLSHMRSVPFENLDIPLGVPIVLEMPGLYEKVVTRNRGGFCYELNGLFCWLLKQIGFDVEMLAARVFGDDGNPGPEFDHMLLRVNRDWIADVGFGDSFTAPMRFTLDEQRQPTGEYRLVEAGARFVLERNTGEGWKPQYDFLLVPRELEEYEAMCEYQQSSPDSIFTQKKVCSLATPDGRITYANGRFIETKSGVRSENEIREESELAGILSSHFGFVLEGDLGKLL